MMYRPIINTNECIERKFSTGNIILECAVMFTPTYVMFLKLVIHCVHFYFSTRETIYGSELCYNMRVNEISVFVFSVYAFMVFDANSVCSMHNNNNMTYHGVHIALYIIYIYISFIHLLILYNRYITSAFRNTPS